MGKINLLGYTRPQLEEVMVGLGEKPFKGRQLFKWLYYTRQYDFNLMTDLTKGLRSRLDDQYKFESLHLETSQKSSDGTEKFLFRLEDGHPVESVLIPDHTRDHVTVRMRPQMPLLCHRSNGAFA